MSSTTPFGPEFYKQLIDMVFSAMDEEQKFVAEILWSMLIAVLKAYWPLVLLLLFLAFIVVTIKAGLGRWGTLGSFLYNFWNWEDQNAKRSHECTHQ